MQLSKIALFSFLGLAAAAPLTERSASTIESDIATVSSELSTLDSDVNSFTGSLIQGLELLVVFDDLKSDITTATSAIDSTGTLDSADSATIYSDVDALATKISTVMSDVEAKASTVASAGYTSDVLDALQTLQSEAASFFTALETYIDSAYTSEVETLATSVNNAFDTAIAEY